MGDEHINTIPKTKSDEFIKSRVENLVPNLSESEGENGCDMPTCFTTFLNILFEADYESDASDYQSCSDEDFLEEIFSNLLFEEEIISTKIDPHHFDAESDLIESMPNHDSFIIPSSSKIDSFLDEFVGELTLLKSIRRELIKLIAILRKIFVLSRDYCTITHLLVHRKNLFLKILMLILNLSFHLLIQLRIVTLSMEEIDLTFTPDDPMPPSIEEDDYDSERDVLILEELLDNYSLSLPVIESYHFDIPSFSHPPAKPPDGNTGILNIKMMGDISNQKVPIPGLTITRVPN
nr:hypothetical protein [Tanacetum cinerariifolium]